MALVCCCRFPLLNARLGVTSFWIIKMRSLHCSLFNALCMLCFLGSDKLSVPMNSFLGCLFKTRVRGPPLRGSDRERSVLCAFTLRGAFLGVENNFDASGLHLLFCGRDYGTCICGLRGWCVEVSLGIQCSCAAVLTEHR